MDSLRRADYISLWFWAGVRRTFKEKNYLVVGQKVHRQAFPRRSWCDARTFS
ncbi:MAG: hypothetical protein HN390_12055 [Anaerolineae bacterium]|nr:hypothetical protein [Anaerolineae bacterium]MBT7191684.1 hypothetical protein [Anaerolineae bacterium]MBT7990364.1 hypothetical protein [Anaerolineae bacterium]